MIDTACKSCSLRVRAARCEALGSVFSTAHVSPQVSQGLRGARSSVLAVLPAVAAESYTRAYPLVAKLAMLTEVEEAFSVMGRVSEGACINFSQRWRFPLY